MGISKNNFDILRIVLALIVMFFHMGTLGNIQVLQYFPGTLSVSCFFVISGYLIVRSYIRNNNLLVYIRSRVMRIYPLYCVVIFSCFFLGALLTFYDYKFYVESSWIYLLSNLAFLNFIQPTLPGVFTDIGNHGAVNGALWTIKIEVMFYISVPFIYGYLFRFISRKILTVIFFILSLVFFYIMSYIIDIYGLNKAFNNQLPSLMSYFMVGALFNFININKKIVCFLLPFSLVGIYSGVEILKPLSVGLIVAFLSFCLPFVRVSKNIGDLSYGIYIWHFPVIQTYIYLGAFSSPLLGVLKTTITVLLLAYISWHFLEKNCINR